MAAVGEGKKQEKQKNRGEKNISMATLRFGQTGRYNLAILGTDRQVTQYDNDTDDDWRRRLMWQGGGAAAHGDSGGTS